MDTLRIPIMIVEDQKPMRRALVEFLRPAFPEAELFEAASGQSALELCRTQPFGLVLADVGLPDIVGIDLVRMMRNLQPGLPVIVVSQQTDPVYADKSIAAGASAYVSKADIYYGLLPAIAFALGLKHAEDAPQRPSRRGVR